MRGTVAKAWGEVMREERERRGVSQRQLSKSLWPKSTNRWGDYETKGRDVPLTTAIQMCEALGLSFNEAAYRLERRLQENGQ